MTPTAASVDGRKARLGEPKIAAFHDRILEQAAGLG